jgi:hypothetical protein
MYGRKQIAVRSHNLDIFTLVAALAAKRETSRSSKPQHARRWFSNQNDDIAANRAG